jgi:hypothetical protein
MVEATTWTVIGILGAALIAFFVDSRTEQRASRAELSAFRVEFGARIEASAAELRSALGARIEASAAELRSALGARIEASAAELRSALGARIDAQAERIDKLVGEVAHHTHEPA